MELTYTYSKIYGIAKTLKQKKYKVGQIVEIVQYIFTDEDVLHLFIKVGLDLENEKAAIDAIGDAMANGEDYFEIQQDVLRSLIAANFYKKELQEMLKALTTPELVETQK